MKTQLIYWPQGGSVEKVAQKVEAKVGATAVVLNSVDLSAIKDAELIILGGSTVGADNWTNSPYKDMWMSFFKNVEAEGISLSGKKVALFGLGNQILYPAHFVDSMQEVATLAQKAGATIVGQTKNEGYQFESSQALDGDTFIGLPLDEDTQAELTDARIETWLAKL